MPVQACLSFCLSFNGRCEEAASFCQEALVDRFGRCWMVGVPGQS